MTLLNRIALMAAALVGTMTTATTASADGQTQHAAAYASQPVLGSCPAYVPAYGADMTASSMAFPTGEAATSAVLLHQVLPREVQRGAEFGYQYHITNLTTLPLQNVVVSQESVDNIEVVSSAPASKTSGTAALWTLGTIEPCETVVINVTGVAEALGAASSCISVSYNNYLCAATNVVEPGLEITKQATQAALSCETVELVYTVCNPGTGATSNVAINDELPAGLTLQSTGSSTVYEQLGTLAPGECREVYVVALAAGPGTFESAAIAVSDNGLVTDSNTTTTVVTEPALEVAATCRSTQFIGRNATYDFSVTNTGSGVAQNAAVTIEYPAGSFVRASAGAAAGVEAATFAFGDLQPGETRDVSVTLTSSNPASLAAFATATANCTEDAADFCNVAFVGIPAVLLEVIDLTDPVEVGQQTTYRITVTNQGTADDSDIVIAVTLPQEQLFVSATGATEESVSGQNVTFAPVPVLEPGEQATWLLTVEALAEGDVRFATELTTENLTSPVRETEATNLYE